MNDDFVSLFTFNRWANARMLDACRKLTPEQYAAEPVPGWTSVRATVWHIAVVIEGWLRGLANDPDESFPTEAELATVDDAERLLERAYRRFDELLPRLTPDWLATPVTYSRRGRKRTLPRGQCCAISSITPPTTGGRSRLSSSGLGSSRRKPTSCTGSSSNSHSRREVSDQENQRKQGTS